MTETAPDPPVAVRHRRVGRERLPVPALVLAVVAIAFFALPFIGLLWKAPWGDVWSILTSDSALTALAPVAVVLAVGHRRRRCCSACRWPGCWPASAFPGRGAGPGAVHAVDGAAAGRRRRRPVLRARPPRPGRPVPRPLVRVHAAVHHRRRRRRPDVRRHAVPRHHRRGRVPPARHPLRGRRPHARRRRAGTCSAASPCRRSAPGSSPAPCSPGPAPSASSAPRSPSPATSPAAPRRCRSPSTSPTRSTPTRRSCSASCSSPSPSACSSPCATGSSAAARPPAA